MKIGSNFEIRLKLSQTGPKHIIVVVGWRVNYDSWISWGKILIFQASFYKEKNKKLKLDMTTEKTSVSL